MAEPGLAGGVIAVFKPTIKHQHKDSRMELKRKLEILADAAKYDASCASNGTDKRTSTDERGIGSTWHGLPVSPSSRKPFPIIARRNS